MDSWPIAYPISVGRIQGGDWPSTVMGEVRMEGRYGVALGESLTSAMAAFEEALQGTGARIEWFGDVSPLPASTSTNGGSQHCGPPMNT